MGQLEKKGSLADSHQGWQTWLVFVRGADVP